MGDELKLPDEEIREGAAFAALSYVFFLWILAFIFKKDNRFAHFHARQGLVIFVLEIICFFMPFIPILGGLLYVWGWILLVVASLYGVYSSLTGKLCHMPFITRIASKMVI